MAVKSIFGNLSKNLSVFCYQALQKFLQKDTYNCFFFFICKPFYFGLLKKENFFSLTHKAYNKKKTYEESNTKPINASEVDKKKCI